MNPINISPKIGKKEYASTRNACKQCAPLGASVAFRGIEGCVPLIHGSQGCSTYIRRYMISHYKEPVDIASSNFSEHSTIFGGNANFNTGIDNIIAQYNPKVVAIASTCLSETIGEDIHKMLYEYKAKNKGKDLPEFVHASTPSYQGTHMDGYHEAVKAMVAAFAEQADAHDGINLMPGFISPEDIRHLKDILEDFGLKYSIIPDYSDSLDNPSWDEYKLIPDGGTTIDELKKSGSAKASIEFGYVLNKGGLSGRIKENKAAESAAELLEKEFSVPRFRCGIPIGVRETDVFFEFLSQLSGKPVPEKYKRERGRLIDSYIDAHKHLFGKRAVVYGEEDLAIGLTQLLLEIGVKPIIIASGGESGRLRSSIKQLIGDELEDCIIEPNMDFERVHELSKELSPDIFIGNSKGYYITRKLQIPLVRVGFPIHDRFGGQRVQHVAYRGTQQLYDRITNAIVQYKQDNSPVGYKYM